nr:unnamed protein product [Callosobruchus analis]
MPLKLGTFKITKNEHLILYSFDVNLVISEVDKLKLKTEKVERLVRKVNGKLNDIFTSTYETFPSISIRLKRGLVNSQGSVFKAITGNLDARDGEKIESLISEVQNNQNKISEDINSQNTLTVELIDNFNKTMSGYTQSISIRK